MELSVTINHTYLLAEVSGTFDVTTATITLSQILAIAYEQKFNKILIDSYTVMGTPNTYDFYSLGYFIADEIRRYYKKEPRFIFKIGFYAMPDLIDPNKFTELLMKNRATNMFVSSNKDAVLKWLGLIGRKKNNGCARFFFKFVSSLLLTCWIEKN